MTAREVADELEVSERTARRDLDALGTAGVPVFSTRGRGGGWRLVGGARTNLTGLQLGEAQALLTMAAISGQGTPQFASAIRKLVQAMPEPIRIEAERSMTAIIRDSSSWANGAAVDPADGGRDQWLPELQQAVVDRCRVAITYDGVRTGAAERRVDPLGLIVKRREWYLLAATENGRRSFRLDRMSAVRVLDEQFTPPESFDLDAAWSQVTTAYRQQADRVTTRAVVGSSTVSRLRAAGVEVSTISERPGGRVEVTLTAWNAQLLASKLAGMVTEVDLVDPPPQLAQRLAQIGADLVSRFPSAEYGSPARPEVRVTVN